jgi:hypothetical protein
VAGGNGWFRLAGIDARFASMRSAATTLLLLCACSRSEPQAGEVVSARAEPAHRAPSASASSAPAAMPVACPNERLVRVSPAELTRELGRTKSAAVRNRFLERLKLEAVPDHQFVGVDVLEATFGTRPRADRLVHVRLERTVDEQTHRISRVAALRAETEGFCALTHEITLDQPPDERSCLGPEHDWPLTLALTRLTSRARDAIRVVHEHGQCGGCGRSGVQDVEFVELSGTRLERVFTATTYSTSYQGCPWPPVETELGAIELTGGFPRAIVETSEHWCADNVDPDNPYKHDVCKPHAERKRHELVKGRYQVVSTTPLKAPLNELLAIADSDFVDPQQGIGWGNRCLTHLKAGSTSYARAACQRGLALGPKPAVRGALLYNLALVAEREENKALACKHLSESLAARAGDAATLKKQAALACKP